MVVNRLADQFPRRLFYPSLKVRIRSYFCEASSSEALVAIASRRAKGAFLTTAELVDVHLPLAVAAGLRRGTTLRKIRGQPRAPVDRRAQTAVIYEALPPRIAGFALSRLSEDSAGDIFDSRQIPSLARAA